MTDDEDLITQRRYEDGRLFLLRALDPAVAPRLSPGLNAVRDALGDGQWHLWSAVLAAGLRASDLAVKTLDQQMHRAVHLGLLERAGVYSRRYDRGSRSYVVDDRRQLRLVDWPTP